jgi:hypothetical protein
VDSANQPLTIKKDHPYQAIGCCIIFPILILFIFVIWLFLPILMARYIGTKRPRATVSYSKGCFRYLNIESDKYYVKNGYFPPKLDGKSFYGPITDVFGRTIPINLPSDFANVAFVDPHREQAIFPNEQKATAMFNSPRNPDGWVKLKGYPARYFRSKNGQWAIFIGNGPDEQVTLTKEILDTIDGNTKNVSQPTFNDAQIKLAPYTYDPTNGNSSVGDIWRFLELPTSNDK